MHDTRRGWAYATFGTAEIGDDRLSRRLIDVASRVAMRPAGTVTEVFDDGADREAAYRLLSNGTVKSEALAEAMFRSTARACARETTIYVAVDGSSLSIADPKKKRPVGAVGAWRQNGRGLHVVSALALNRDGVPLGVCEQTWWVRTRLGPAERNDFRPLDEKESRFLAEAIQNAHRRMQKDAPAAHVVYLADRGFDIASVLSLCQQAAPCAFIIRAAQKKRIALLNGERRYLPDVVRAMPILGHAFVRVPERNNRPARTARVQIQAAAVELLVPVSTSQDQRRENLPLNCVWVRELDGPKGDLLSWLLLTTESIDTFEHITAVIRAYAYRWRIEEFHRAWKRGGCNVEDMQLRSREAMLKWATIHGAVAARAIHLARRARTEPDVPASTEFTQLEMDAAIVLRRRRTNLRKGDVPTLAAMVGLVADIGGYVGKSSGGPPGPTVIARGLERLAIAVDVLSIERSDE
jgi:hypothetical protein